MDGRLTVPTVLDRLDNIPAELRQLGRWVVWRRERRKGKWTKVPYQGRAPAVHAASDDPSTWSTFAETVEAARRDDTLGIGFMLGDGFVGVDFDHCIDPATGHLAEWASEYLTRLDSYSEISPSGTGVHILAHGSLPPKGRKKGPHEFYEGGRFFTVTGDHFPDTPSTIEERAGELLAVHAAVFGEKNGKHEVNLSSRDERSDEDLGSRDARSVTASREAADPFAALYRGDWSAYPSQSEADLALVGRLARMTPDPVSIDRMFRSSGLMRAKWDQSSGATSYGERTIAKALESAVTNENPTARPYQLYSAADLDQLPPQEWVVENAIPDNAIVALIGGKGTLKTFVALDLACRVSVGEPWQDRATSQRRVLYVYAEGPFGAKARVEAWCKYQTHATGRVITRGDLALWLLPTRIPINNPTAVAALLTEIRHLDELPRLVIVDTLNINLDGDENGEGMGGFIAGCAALRDALRATVIAVHHTPLGTDDRGRGHSSFDGAIDTRLIVSRDAERVTLECTHQRNGQDGWSVVFESVPIAGSLALKPSAPNAGQLKGQRRAILELVHSDGPFSCTAWQRTAELSPSSFHKARRWLLANAYVKQEGKHYTTTDAGRLALSTPSAPSAPSGAP